MNTEKLQVPKLSALRKLNQKTLNAWVKADVAYQQANNDLSAAYDNAIGGGDLKLQKRLEKLTEKHFDNAYEFWGDLPKDEQKSAEHFMLNFRGY
jgi:hypothetical protein